jgi:hypothetical protein
VKATRASTGGIVAALLLAAALAGCGAGSPRLTHAELVRRATSICVAQANKILRIPRGPANAINATGYLGAVLSVAEEGVKRFHSLRPPAEDEQLYNAFLRELDRNTNQLRTLRAAAAARDRKDYVIGLANVHRSRLRIDALERRLGLKRCVAG